MTDRSRELEGVDRRGSKRCIVNKGAIAAKMQNVDLHYRGLRSMCRQSYWGQRSLTRLCSSRANDALAARALLGQKAPLRPNCKTLTSIIGV